jgi:glycerol-3-phosphate dehydrogenase
MREEPASAESLHPDFPFTMAEVAWACRHEMACRVEDVLARRLRMLFLDAKAAMESAPAVAAWMARELGHDDAWAASEVEDFRSVAEGYLP